jgi:hypothetical protein
LLYRHVQVSGILFVALPSCTSVEGHTVFCFTVMFKGRGEYCFLLYLQVRGSRGILFVALPYCSSVEGA